MSISAIREQLKKDLGYNSKQVSIKKERCGYSHSISITIRDHSVDYNKVKSFGEKFHHVRRCEASHEILEGCNTYVSVEVCDQVLDKWSEKYLPELNQVAKSLNENTGVRVGNFTLYLNRFGSSIKIHSDKLDTWMPFDYSVHDMRSIAADMYIMDMKQDN